MSDTSELLPLDVFEPVTGPFAMSLTLASVFLGHLQHNSDRRSEATMEPVHGAETVVQ